MNEVRMTFIQNLEIITSFITAVITALAAIAAVGWFYRRRDTAPRVNVEHEINFVNLENGTNYVGVHVKISNVGKVLAKLKVKGEESNIVIVEELKPYLSKNLKSQKKSPEYEMQFLGARTFPTNFYVEPFEKQSILFEFIIQQSTETIKVYSHINNVYNKGVGWDTTTIHEVNYERNQPK